MSFKTYDCMNPVWLHERREQNLESFTELSSKLAILKVENINLRETLTTLRYINQEAKHLNGLLRVENSKLREQLKEGQNG